MNRRALQVSEIAARRVIGAAHGGGLAEVIGRADRVAAERAQHAAIRHRLRCCVVA